MKSRWDETEARRCAGDLELRCYTSRLLGSDPTLVLHGGGNTSVKLRERNLLGEDEDILYVKGSGWDLATIEPAGRIQDLSSGFPQPQPPGQRLFGSSGHRSHTSPKPSPSRSPWSRLYMSGQTSHASGNPS